MRFAVSLVKTDRDSMLIPRTAHRKVIALDPIGSSPSVAFTSTGDYARVTLMQRTVADLPEGAVEVTAVALNEVLPFCFTLVERIPDEYRKYLGTAVMHVLIDDRSLVTFKDKLRFGIYIELP